MIPGGDQAEPKKPGQGVMDVGGEVDLFDSGEGSSSSESEEEEDNAMNDREGSEGAEDEVDIGTPNVVI